MSILLKWKNKLQDNPTCEGKIREFDQRVSLLKNENVELHKRIDQLEALCQTSVDNHQTRFLEEHIRQLEEENGRLCAQNHCQRQEYERFLDQLTTMILRTAVMQENIRKECASIYHVIERLSTLKTNSIEDRQIDLNRKKSLRSLSWENLHPFIYSSTPTSPKTTAEFLRHFYRNQSPLSSSSSLSSCSSTTTHCSFSTSGSWTLDLPFYDQDRRNSRTILPLEHQITDTLKEKKQDEQTAVSLQRSETFVVGKIPSEESTKPTETPVISSINEKASMTVQDRSYNSHVQRCSTTRTMASSPVISPTVARPSRLPSRSSINRPVVAPPPPPPPSSSNTTSTSTPRASSTSTIPNSLSSPQKKISKLPVRTGPSVLKSNLTSTSTTTTTTKKSNLATSSGAPKGKKDPSNINTSSTRSVSANNHSSTKKSNVRPLPVTNTSSSNSTNKIRSRSSTHTSTSISATKRVRTNPSGVKKIVHPAPIEVRQMNEPISPMSNEHINSTSSESSIEENHSKGTKVSSSGQDEGYSTWSSSDVKEDLLNKDFKRMNHDNDDRRRNTGLVKSWLDTSNQSPSKKPVKEVEIEKLEEFTRELSDGTSIICPFVRNRCSNGIVIPLASTSVSPTSVEKDISLDSLEGAENVQKKESTRVSPSSSSSSSSSSTFSRSETFERILVPNSLPTVTDDSADSTASTCSDLQHLCPMSGYMEDHYLESNLTPPIKPIGRLFKAEKRLMFPGLLNRLIYLRRVLSDSDLRQKVCCIGENEMQYHVYHSNTIHEHSLELNLSNTYGSESELHVWAKDCAEQRSSTQERSETNFLPPTSSTHIERMIRMSFDEKDEDDLNHYQFDGEDYDQQLALERQHLLQQIYEYPWLLQEDDIDQATVYSSPPSDQPLLSPSPDLIVPSHNPDFYQLCALTNSSSFATSFGTNSRHTTPPIASSVL